MHTDSSTTHPAPLPVALVQAMRQSAEKLTGTPTPIPLRTGRRRSGETLRPGSGTPLWNVLVEEITPLLQPYGEQARLARALGVHRQTINTWFKSCTRMPDAERTLQLLAWMMTKRRENTTLLSD